MPVEKPVTAMAPPAGANAAADERRARAQRTSMNCCAAAPSTMSAEPAMPAARFSWPTGHRAQRQDCRGRKSEKPN